MLKFIVTDLDNTLLDDNHALPQSSADLIKEAMTCGVTIALATGRSFASASGIAAKLGSDTPVICYNGSLVKTLDGLQTIFSAFVDPEVCRGVVDFACRNNVYIQMYEDDVIVVERLKWECHPDPDIEYAGYREVDDFSKMTGILTPKILLAATCHDVPELQQKLEKEFGDRAFFTQSESYLIEIMPKGVNKGAALDILAKHLGFQRNEIMALGDNTNDMLLLQHAGLGVAVANSVPALKEIADYVCTGERSLGFNEALERFVLKNFCITRLRDSKDLSLKMKGVRI